MKMLINCACMPSMVRYLRTCNHGRRSYTMLPNIHSSNYPRWTIMMGKQLGKQTARAYKTLQNVDYPLSYLLIDVCLASSIDSAPKPWKPSAHIAWQHDHSSGADFRHASLAPGIVTSVAEPWDSLSTSQQRLLKDGFNFFHLIYQCLS